VELDTTEFARWLTRHYARTTVRKLCADVATMARSGPEPPEAKRLAQRKQDFRWAWGRWAAFCKATNRRNMLPEPARHERQPGRRPKRQRPALSIPEGPWAALRKRVRADSSITGRVLDVLVSTGLRIGDVLRVPESAIAEARARPDGVTVLEVKGAKPVIVSVRGAPKAWERLHDALKPGQLVADAVSPGSSWEAGSGAYARVRRALKAHAAEVGLDPATVHLHRTRRTVAVTLIRAGASLEEVQRVLQQNNRSTTERYVDEAMGDVATKALERINR